MRRHQSGFTLIELLIVISIIGLLAAVLLPEIIGSRAAANVFGDQRNLGRHFQWLEYYKNKHKHWPAESGHKFVLSTWTSEVIEHTEENFDCFFNPSIRERDANWIEMKKQVQKGENPWPDIKNTTSKDTHYAGRHKDHLKSLGGGEEALMADDNEDGWSHDDGTVNILLNNSSPRSYSYQMLREMYGLGPFDKEHPIETAGPNSPIPACQKLAL